MAADPADRWMKGLIVLIAILLAGCYNNTLANEFTEPAGENPMPGQRWRVIPAGGAPAVGGADIAPELVEVTEDGRAMTVFFLGGNPSCYGVTGVSVERRDPELPNVVVGYGMRLGVMGCTADLASLAIRVPLEPPFER